MFYCNGSISQEKAPKEQKVEVGANVPGSRVSWKIIEEDIDAQEKRQVVARVGIILEKEKQRTQEQGQAQSVEIDWKKTIEQNTPTTPAVVGQAPGSNKNKKGNTELLGIDGLGELVERCTDDMAKNNEEHTNSLHPVDKMLVCRRDTG